MFVLSFLRAANFSAVSVLWCLGSTASSPQDAYGAEVVIAAESARMRTEVPIFTSAAVVWRSSCRGHGCALEER